MNHLQTYANRVLKLMDKVEDITGKMFHESHENLHNDFWKANDAKNIRLIRVVHGEICRVLDDLEMD